MTPTSPRPIDKKSRGNHATQAQIARTAKLRSAMGMASDAEFDALDAASGRQADCLFLRLMIRHQEGAIPMAEAILDVGSEPRVLQVAETIRAGQTAEIDAMQGMRQRLTCMV